MQIDEQLVCECELILSQGLLDQSNNHILDNHLKWYRNACKTKNDETASLYKSWVEKSLKRAKEKLAEMRYNKSQGPTDLQ